MNVLYTKYIKRSCELYCETSGSGISENILLMIFTFLNTCYFLIIFYLKLIKEPTDKISILERKGNLCG